MQWGPALGAGLIAGAVLLVVPAGSPWSILTFSSCVIMGRIVPPETGLPLVGAWLIHLSISVLLGLVISRVVAGLRHWRATVAGALGGLLLYVLNLAMVAVAWPELRGHEFRVVFTHVFFGLIAAGAYRGLLRRRPA